MTFLVQFF